MSLWGAPPQLQVTDQGVYSGSLSSLYASWAGSDPESSIVEYQYRITQDSITGIAVRNWTSAGTALSVSASGLVLSRGKPYYFGVKAKNGTGVWSAVKYSDGIKVQ